MNHLGGLISETGAGVVAALSWIAGLCVVLTCGLRSVRQFGFHTPRAINICCSLAAIIGMWRSYVIFMTPIVQGASLVYAVAIAGAAVVVLGWTIAQSVRHLSEMGAERAKRGIMREAVERADAKAIRKVAEAISPIPPHTPGTPEGAPPSGPPNVH